MKTPENHVYCHSWHVLNDPPSAILRGQSLAESTPQRILEWTHLHIAAPQLPKARANARPQTLRYIAPMASSR
jgi:hypothetical protein